MTSTPQRLFRVMTTRTLRRTFGGLLVSGAEHLQHLPPGGIVVMMNHPSWWDPLVGLQLTRLMEDRTHSSAMDAEALERYPIFKHLGFLPVARGDLRSGMQLLRQARERVASGGVFWLTAQGHFADPRQRPLDLAPGAAYLGASLTSGTVIPVAVEYGFGVEKQPEIFVRIGTPLPASRLSGLPRTQRQDRLREALEDTMDHLRDLVVAGERTEFVALVEGRRGLGGLYDAWLRLRAVVSGRRFHSEHRALLAAEEHARP